MALKNRKMAEQGGVRRVGGRVFKKWLPSSSTTGFGAGRDLKGHLR